MADAAACVSQQRPDKISQVPRDLARPHEMCREDEERDGQQCRMVDPGEDLLHHHGIWQRTEIGFLDRQSRDAEDEEYLEPEQKQRKGEYDDQDNHAGSTSAAFGGEARSMAPMKLSAKRRPRRAKPITGARYTYPVGMPKVGLVWPVPSTKDDRWYPSHIM